MGHRVLQRILTCAICGKTPDDGEPMWEMCCEHWCEDCAKEDESDNSDQGAGQEE